MIKSFIQRLRGKNPRAAHPLGTRREYAADMHQINPDWVDKHASQVVRTLKEGGFEAYIVGGAVRDLLLGLRPKDFDVATNATPEQVKKLFRRAFIIGRRFRIVHVVFGGGRNRNVVEVSTFRALLDHDAEADQVSGNERTAKERLAGMEHAVGDAGRVLRDNIWGPQEEDAARRDLTINAMYYDPERRVVVDYYGGFQDIRAGQLRMIGDAAQRYREDPVRAIRVVRFAAKLAARGFVVEPHTAAPLAAAAELLDAVPQSRLFDEMLKLLLTGHAEASVAELKRLGLARSIYPLLELVVARSDGPLVAAALADTDRRVAEGKPVVPSFLLGCVLWPDVYAGWQQREADGEHRVPALHAAIDAAFDAHVGDVSGRGRLGADMREMWLMQPRFEKRRGKAPLRLVEQKRFRAGFDFLRLRASTGEIEPDLADWWQEFGASDTAGRERMIEALSGATPAPRKRRRRGGKSAPKKEDAAQTDAREARREDAVAPDGADQPARRKPRGRRGAAAKDSAAVPDGQ
ncbi:MAG: polynucleotide adenylyltransferase PcnB [Ottowia sp.]|nr:polynucleotide adenylyltransferase PcnB [Ottowia sp.]